MLKNVACPLCGGSYPVYANPLPTTDVVIHEPGKGVVVIRRRNDPVGLAVPGGFIDEGEWVEDAAIREMKEETGLDVVLDGILGVYSRPDRDPRSHTMTVVFAGHPRDAGALKAGDDAAGAFWCPLEELPESMCFDHLRVLKDFVLHVRGERPLGALSSEWLETPAGRANG